MNNFLLFGVLICLYMVFVPLITELIWRFVLKRKKITFTVEGDVYLKFCKYCKMHDFKPDKWLEDTLSSEVKKMVLGVEHDS